MCKRCDEFERELKDVKKELKQARRVLEKISEFAWGTAQGAAKEMAGNVPQRRWAYLIKAQFETCNHVLGLMGRDRVELKKKKGLTGLGQGLFNGFFGGVQ